MSASTPQSVITWTPATGSNTLNQTVQYKATDSATWISFATVASGVSTSTITGLVNNTIYDFQVIDNCSVGGPSSSGVIHAIQFACVQMTITPTYNNIQVSFNLANLIDVTKMDVVLLAANGSTSIATQTITAPTNTAYTLNFTGLTPSTTYNVMLTNYAGAAFAYSASCPQQGTATSAAPVCAAPTNVSAVLS